MPLQSIPDDALQVVCFDETQMTPEVWERIRGYVTEFRNGSVAEVPAGATVTCSTPREPSENFDPFGDLDESEEEAEASWRSSLNRYLENRLPSSDWSEPAQATPMSDLVDAMRYAHAHWGTRIVPPEESKMKESVAMVNRTIAMEIMDWAPAIDNSLSHSRGELVFMDGDKFQSANFCTSMKDCRKMLHKIAEDEQRLALFLNGVRIHLREMRTESVSHNQMMLDMLLLPPVVLAWAAIKMLSEISRLAGNEAYDIPPMPKPEALEKEEVSQRSSPDLSRALQCGELVTIEGQEFCVTGMTQERSHWGTPTLQVELQPTRLYGYNPSHTPLGYSADDSSYYTGYTPPARYATGVGYSTRNSRGSIVGPDRGDAIDRISQQARTAREAQEAIEAIRAAGVNIVGERNV